MFTTSKLYIAENFWPSLSDSGTKSLSARSIQPKFPEMDRFGPTGKFSKKTGPPFEVDCFFPVGPVEILVEWIAPYIRACSCSERHCKPPFIDHGIFIIRLNCFWNYSIGRSPYSVLYLNQEPVTACLVYLSGKKNTYTSKKTARWQEM